MGISVLGSGMYVPDLIADNEAFTKIVETSDEWITTRTGIKKRHITDGMLAYQMGAVAAKRALDSAGIAPGEIDMILGTTCTNDFLTPSLACLVGREIGVEDAPGMDLNAACAGYVYALDVAKKYLDSGECKCILIVSSEIVTRMVDYADRSTCVLFGDGAAATVVSSGDGRYASFLQGRPMGANKIFTKLPAPRNPFQTQSVDYGDDIINEFADFHMYMAGNDVYKFATTAMPEAVIEASARAGITVDQLDMVIPHQANARIVNTAIKRMQLPPERFYINIHEYGNISSACIPVAIDELSRGGRLNRGDKICLVGFGAGLVYGACVFEW